MTPYIHSYSVDVRSGRVNQRESAPFAEGDALADKYIVRLMDGMQAVDLTGAVITADVLRPDGKTVSVVGQTVDGAAEVTLDKYCYAVRGEVSITVRAVVGDMAQTLLCVHAMVSQTTTDLVVDNGLIGNLTELIQAIIGTGGGTGGTGGNIALDTTLTQDGMAADAAAVGQRIAEVEEKIPVVPEWAMQTTKPAYSAAEVGADAQGTASAAVDAHNADAEAHPVICESIRELSDRLNALADSDDTTLDQLSEIVAYIKNNKSLIDSITTGKVSTSDIVNNLTTNSSTKPLSAAQGVALKKLIDAIVVPTNVSELANDAGYLTEHQDISGLLPRTELDTAIDTALAEAKESGEFDGPQGVSVVNVYTKSQGLGDGAANVIAVVLSDESVYTFTVKNGSNGAQGYSVLRYNGTGATRPNPDEYYELAYDSVLGDNVAGNFLLDNAGNLYHIASVDSSIYLADSYIALVGAKGETGATGETGPAGADGSDGADGKDGTDGVGVASVTQTTTSSADGGSNVITVTLTSGTKSTFTVKNGSKGSTGADGKDGADGATAAEVIAALSTETWTFTLADGTTVSKVVPLV